MKKLMKYFFIFTLVPTLFLSSCKEENDVYTPEPGPDLSENFETLKDYMVANDLDLPDVLTGWITAAPAQADLATFLDTYDIIDIRSADAYAAGHIEGAVNSSLENILNTAGNTTKPILVACYTGQTASHAVVALRLSGYTDAKVLKWGMSGWNSTLSGPWQGKSGAENGAVGEGHANWSTTPAIANNQTFNYPGFNTTATSGAAILEERVNAMILGGFKGVNASDVLTTPSNYFINNYWSQDDVDHYGHIAGAYRIQPLSLENNEIANLDPDATICTYCWTGQTSSMITAYLNVVGYNAVSLKFGSNNMIYPTLESHKFVTPTVDLPLVTSTPTNVFGTLTDYLVANDLDLPDVLTGWITGAPAQADLATFLSTYDIIDIRSADAYNAGHIEGAINSTLGNIVSDAASTTKPILVACYTGQTASHAVVALRLSGYTDAKVLKWGMSGWNSTLSGSWESNSGATNGAVAEGHSNWVTSAVESNQSFDYPSVMSTYTDGANILQERVTAMTTNGFKGVNATDVLTSPSNYFINNYWAQTDVDHYGHIAGAYRVQPLSIEGGELANLDASAQICTYCWTGQTSSMITAYLNVLGYDAVSLKFGSNKMIYPSLESHKFVAPTTDLPLVN
ncbi:rhodanese-like domain-containing protein [Marinifilum flexuosum]|uniref:rhodanese-like domain-containing protein n=1 Tax=Marinifilum flexuosum TaxID=1117708 RepID=UPI0024905FF6|nr:rhodanese-like domain-containing protein [Marinifilum flexuosum]